MKNTLQPGITYQHRFTVTAGQTVPAIYPMSPDFQAMPAVFATGYMVAFLEWACVLAIKPYFDSPDEQTVGTHVNVTHQAATPPGREVVADVELIAVEGKKLVFNVKAHDGVNVISQGTHERFVISRAKFDQRLQGQ